MDGADYRLLSPSPTNTAHSNPSCSCGLLNKVTAILLKVSVTLVCHFMLNLHFIDCSCFLFCFGFFFFFAEKTVKITACCYLVQACIPMFQLTLASTLPLAAEWTKIYIFLLNHITSKVLIYLIFIVTGLNF